MTTLGRATLTVTALHPENSLDDRMRDVTGHRIDVIWGTPRLVGEPVSKDICAWVNTALDCLSQSQLDGLPPDQSPAGVSVRIVSEEEMTSLNGQYRHRHQVTNVLSFADRVQEESGRVFLGDIVLCNQVIFDESQEYGKTFAGRYAHLLIHGLLHLLGQDHADPVARTAMENLECRIMAQLGFSDPYQMTSGQADE